MPKDFKRFIDHVIQEDCAGQTSKTTDSDDILAITEEVAKCGASETSDEYYMAIKLFAKPSNRSFFYAMKTMKGDSIGSRDNLMIVRSSAFYYLTVMYLYSFLAFKQFETCVFLLNYVELCIYYVN